jgi:hypothetical protein
MSDYTTPEGNYTDLATQFSHSSIAAVPVNGNDDDRRRVTRPERRPATKSRTPEKIMVSTRRSVVMNHNESSDELCFVDDVDALTLELAKKAVQRAIFVIMETHARSDDRNSGLHGPGRHCGQLDCDCYAQYLFRNQQEWGLRGNCDCKDGARAFEK